MAERSSLSSPGSWNGRPDVAGRKAQVWRGVGLSAGVKIVAMGSSAVLGILTTRLILDNYGQAAYAQYGLLVAIALLLPFADLGMGAALMNAIGGSDDPGRDQHVRRVIVTSIRVLTMAAAVIATLAVVLWVSGLWPTLLGEGLVPGTGAVAATLALVLIGVAMPFGIGQRMLTGLGKNYVTIGLGGLQPPLMLGTVALAVWAGWDIGSFLAVVPYAVALLLALAGSVVALRMLRPISSGVVRAAARRSSEPGARVMNVAWPMIIMSAALPLGMQSDRLVLSHVAGVSELATYNLAAQIFTPVWALVAASGMTLWPIFARDRSTGGKLSPYPIAALFGLGALTASLLLAAASPWLTEVASGGQIALSWGLVAAFVALMAMQGLKFPLGMFMTDSRGLKFQAIMVCLMTPFNIALSIWLAGELGALGPVIGSAASVAVFQVLANALYVRRRRREQATQSDAESAESPALAGAGAGTEA